MPTYISEKLKKKKNSYDTSRILTSGCDLHVFLSHLKRSLQISSFLNGFILIYTNQDVQTIF